MFCNNLGREISGLSRMLIPRPTGAYLAIVNSPKEHSSTDQSQESQSSSDQPGTWTQTKHTSEPPFQPVRTCTLHSWKLSSSCPTLLCALQWMLTFFHHPSVSDHLCFGQADLFGGFYHNAFNELRVSLRNKIRLGMAYCASEYQQPVCMNAAPETTQKQWKWQQGNCKKDCILFYHLFFFFSNHEEEAILIWHLQLEKDKWSPKTPSQEFAEMLILNACPRTQGTHSSAPLAYKHFTLESKLPSGPILHNLSYGNI